MWYNGKEYKKVKPKKGVPACEQCDLSDKPECGCDASEEMMQVCWKENIIYKKIR